MDSMKNFRASGLPFSRWNNGDSGGPGRSTNMILRLETGQEARPGAAAMRIEMPCRKGSVLDAGRVIRQWVALSKSGRKVTALRARLMAALNLSSDLVVNSPQRRKPANAVQQAAYSVT